MDLRKAVEIQSDNTIARAVVAFLPLFLENQAIIKYINQTGDRMLRNVMPEILSAEEAALMAQKDNLSMDDDQITKTFQIISEYQERFRIEQNKDQLKHKMIM